METGVPQGTILGPLLFLIYINDLYNLLPKNSIHSYADDTVIMCSEKSWEKTTAQMNNYLSIVEEWLIENQLSLNITKSEYITFVNYNDMYPKRVEVKINGVNLTRSQTVKYLGITLDKNLKWTKHIQNITKRLRYLIFVFAKLQKILDCKALVNIYYALFNSISTYGIVAWGSAYKNSLAPIVQLQKKIVKIIYKCKNTQKTEPPLEIKENYYYNALNLHYCKLSQNYTFTRQVKLCLKRYLCQVLN